jgi:hypothetical protein
MRVSICPALTEHVTEVETSNAQWPKKKTYSNEKLFERPNISPVMSTGWLVGYDQTERKISKNLKPEVNALSWKRIIR